MDYNNNSFIIYMYYTYFFLNLKIKFKLNSNAQVGHCRKSKVPIITFSHQINNFSVFKTQQIIEV